MASTHASRNREPRTRDELLFLWRTGKEASHRHFTHLYAIQLTYMPSVLNIDQFPAMSVTDFIDTCNKSVPIYIIPSPNGLLLRMVLHNFIYRRWFRPYRSEIERLQFICKFIAPDGLAELTPSQATINTLLSLNRAICAEVETRRQAYKNEIELSSINQTALSLTLAEVKNHELYVLQPLFRAMMIVTCSYDYHNEGSNSVGKLPVFLVRTGIEEGLSGPITFDSIQGNICHGLGDNNGDAVETTLEVAIDFVLALEAREAAVFGLHPDPAAVWEADEDRLGVLREVGGDVVGPSSNFVDEDKYPQWQGEGEVQDSRIMAAYERRAFSFETRRAAGEFDAYIR